MDSSSELVHSLLPIFMTTVLGASIVSVGLIEGVAEATAAITKVFSGALSRLLQEAQVPPRLGYGLAGAHQAAVPARGNDSVGVCGAIRRSHRQGHRGAPRDALVADLRRPALRGAAYGLRQALDSVGAVAGPLLAVACMACSQTTSPPCCGWQWCRPSLSVALLVVAVREPEHSPYTPAVQNI